MNFNRRVALAVCLMVSSIGGAEVTHEQQVIYSQNPHAVQKAGAFEDPKVREQFIANMQKASRFVRSIAYGCSAVTLGCLVLLVRAESIKGRIGSLAAAILFAAVAVFLDKVSVMQAKMALAQETIVTEVPVDVVAGVKLVGVADGVHIFSTANCPPCKLLHKVVPQIQEKFPTLAIFEYEINEQNTTAQAVVQRMGISVLSTPLTVVVKDGVIARIIVGYLNLDDYAQKLGEALR